MTAGKIASVVLGLLAIPPITLAMGVNLAGIVILTVCYVVLVSAI